MLLDKNPGPTEDAARPALVGYSVTGSMSDDGTPLPLPSPRHDIPRYMNDPPDPSIPSISSYEQAWQRLIDLISSAIPQDELPSLIETIFSDEKTTDMIDCLLGVSAQAFIDVIDGVCHHALYFRGIG